MATIQLGERTYKLEALPLRRASSMRKRIGAEVATVAELVGQTQGISINDPEVVKNLLTVASGFIVDLPDKLFALLCEYSPEIKADENYLLDHALDEQVTTAFLEVIGLLFPFGKLISTLSGLLESETSKSSPLQPGEKAP